MDGHVVLHASEDHFRALGTSLQLVACDAFVRACEPARQLLLERLEGKPKLKRLLQVSTRGFLGTPCMHPCTASGFERVCVRPCTAQGLSDLYGEEEEGIQGGDPLDSRPFSWMARCLVNFEKDPCILEESDRAKHPACVDELRGMFRESIQWALPGPWWTSPADAESGDEPQSQSMAQEENWLLPHSHEERGTRALSKVGPPQQPVQLWLSFLFS